MKFILLIFLLPIVAFSQKVNFLVCEGLWSKPLKGAVIVVQSDTVSQSFNSDEKGKVSFDKLLTACTIIISHPSGNYKARTFLLDSNFSENKPIYLYPTLEYEDSFPDTRPLPKIEIDTSSYKVIGTDDHDHSFNGGIKALKDFLVNNTVYPVEAIQNNWEGRTSIGFMGEKDGRITRVTIIKSSGFEILDDEAKRIMRSSPKWITPKINGQLAVSYLSLPITFKFN